MLGRGRNGPGKMGMAGRPGKSRPADGITSWDVLPALRL
ncbi:hypothetical protein CVCC1112_3596 [Paenarthrobacter nicotinovorans]|nr:hypothetical protein ANMWB30_10140 [Arthrobacter sp. MWB30]GAT88937.1 hypothetical protein CVCC1112_3596 [Paenarthrobacter nicotinovorans]